VETLKKRRIGCLIRAARVPGEEGTKPDSPRIASRLPA
jgi:hypothetical protein